MHKSACSVGRCDFGVRGANIESAATTGTFEPSNEV